MTGLPPTRRQKVGDLLPCDNENGKAKAEREVWNGEPEPLCEPPPPTLPPQPWGKAGSEAEKRETQAG